MNAFEALCGAVRHCSPLRHASGIWDVLKPVYNQAFKVFARNGVTRQSNRSDLFCLSPKLRNMPDQYEPDVWHRVIDNGRAK